MSDGTESSNVSMQCVHGYARGVPCYRCRDSGATSPALTAALTAWRAIPEGDRAWVLEEALWIASTSPGAAEDDAILAALELLREAGR